MEQLQDKKFQSFEDLEVYKAARSFRKDIYSLCRSLPQFEKFALVTQMRRAAISITNNIAEGHGRYHLPDQIRFALQTRGSLQELIDDLNICADEKYVPPEQLGKLKEAGWNVLKILNGWIRYLRDKRI